MEIEYEGKKYPFDLDDLDIEQSLKIEKHIDGTILDWEAGLLTGRTICFQALGWAILRDGDMDTPIASVNFKLGKLIRAFHEALEAEKKAADAKKEREAETGPTGGAASNGRTRAPASSPSG